MSSANVVPSCDTMGNVQCRLPANFRCFSGVSGEETTNAARLIQFHNASTREEIESAFAAFARERPDALFVGTDPFFSSRRVQLVNLTARHAIPTSFSNRE